MVTDLRTDSSDYRTELLSPAAAGENITTAAREPSWRINMDEFHLPQKHMDASFDFGFLFMSLWRQKKIAEYYKRQEKLLKGYNEVDSYNELGKVPGGLTENEMKQIERSERVAIYASNIGNMVLFIAKVYASIESRSLAVIASTMDSLLDLLSGFILWFTAHAMRKPNLHKYPIGKNRMQPVGIVLISETQPENDPVKEKWMIAIMASATVVKLALMTYCRRFKNQIVRAYAQDHFFDVITNSIGLTAAILAIKFYWWIDPLGAILIALYTISNWANTVIDNVWSLIGKTAPPEYLAKLTYLIWNHNEEIKHIATVRAYTFGCNYFVEIDIVLPEKMSLNQAHNIGETLQDKLEKLPEIDRAFVHVDFDATHKPEHRPKVS
ncbi:Metal tolerance protein [Quillaja saponaria]|uniref:Metal tolerance protein n=1 Tax=Quillaja saponaria TaxID=32244 RepID=A0AAD7QIG0_QUISA|nr:Metal tolerance protein [Quillaja saponaria]